MEFMLLLRKIKSKLALIVTLIVILFLGLFVHFPFGEGPVIPVYAANSVSIQVNGSNDTTDADDKITLREAILLVEGKLQHALTAQERALISGNFQNAQHFNILLATDVTLESQLPDITTDNVVVESIGKTRRVIDGQNKAAIGLHVKAAHFDASTIEFRNFTEEEIHIESPAAKDHDFTILGVKFTDGKKGLVIKGPDVQAAGKAKMHVVLADNEFTNLKDTGLTVHSSVKGDYDFRHNHFEKLDVQVAALLQLGGGTGNITVDYTGNTHSTKNGIGSTFEELNHNGHIKWEIDHNEWIGGKIGLETHFSVEGQKNFSNNQYKLQTNAGLVLKTNPINNVLLKVNLDTEAMKFNNIGWSLDVKGRTEISTRLFDIVDNKVGVDGFVAAGGTGFWKDKGSKYNVNAEIGIRILSVGGIGFDLFYSHDFINSNGKKGFDVRGFHDSLFIDHSEILSNGRNGIAVDDTHTNIVTSTICFNGEDGIHITGDSHVTANRDIIDVNGPPDVNNLSDNPVDATSNDWGPVTADEMNHKPYPSNISVIFDVFDDSTQGFVAYAQWANPGVGCRPTSPTPTLTPTPTVSPSPTVTPTVPLPSPTNTPTPTSTPSPTLTPSAVPTLIPSISVSPT